MYATFDGELILKNSGAVTESTEGVGLALPLHALGDFKAIIKVDAVDGDGDPVLITIESDATAAFNGTPTLIASQIIAAPGLYEIPLSGRMIRQRDPDAGALRVAVTMEGEAPSINYRAHLVPA